MSEKIQKILARAGKGSRREMERAISDGRVSLNGKIAALGERATETDEIRLDGHIVKFKSEDDVPCRVLIYNKALGEVCTRNDPEQRKTVFDRLPVLKQGRWVAVGRLDINTTGLLIFTTDGELANRLMHPSNEVEREYAVRVFGEVTEQTIQNLRQGVQLEDGPAKFNKVVFAGGEGINRWFHVTLSEGRNREVRRIWETQEVQVSRLSRIRYGDITLPRTLPMGGWAELEVKEVNYLRKLVDMRPIEMRKEISRNNKIKNLKANRIRKAIRKSELREQGDAPADKRRKKGR
ncbi:ribosomal large subunit pseudouridine synthase B [Catenovulum agarivorans DS-2]|uniref:Pseudouridine synthase n=1 Tax=Catenovulum agarivorans DS-2 TaxID=1328313 RepID=W7R419_9ALTE|nr:23S rRNA pseudouridine(2605) synthase RluB [Catenovulum agarivorans]EWH12370.1 ribosomal large subunit pseudouridine synthase B [Catenovulum agarivorans DS-2]